MKTIMKSVLCVVSLLLVVCFSVYSQEIYRWVDERGNINYTTRYDWIPPQYRNQVSEQPEQIEHNQKARTQVVEPAQKAEQKRKLITRSKPEEPKQKSPSASSKRISPADQPILHAKKTGKFTLKSPAFSDRERIPYKYARRGEDLSPPLIWENPPKGTKSYVLTVEDPDAPRKTWVHWVIFNIPGDQTGLPEGIPNEKVLANGIQQARNDFWDFGYGGPDPPSGVHRYIFTLIALDVEKMDKLRRRIIKKHTLGKATLTGLYG